MVSFLLIAMIVLLTATGLLAYVANVTWETRRMTASAEAFQAAEAGLDKAFFRLQATQDWTSLAQNPTTGWTALPTTGAEYTTTFGNLTSSTTTIVSTGRKAGPRGYTYRKIQADVTGRRPRAFDYSLFGERVGFHNHMKVNYGLAINSRVWSNSDIVIHPGLVMNGDFTAVGKLTILTTPTSLSPTVYTGQFLDGTPGSPFYAPNFNLPVPERIPFPVYDFADAKEKAMAAGTYFATPADFYAYIAARTTTWAATNRQFYAFPSPLPGNADRTIALMDKTMKSTGIVSRAALDGSIFYVQGSVSLKGAPDTLLILRGGLVVEGSVTIARPMELYAKPTTPAIAATGKIDITDTNPTDGTGGPVTIEGIIYTLAECHIHQSHPYNAVSVKGIEVANYVHNCEWFSFTYSPWPGVKGFSEEAGAASLTITKWRELPAGPP